MIPPRAARAPIPSSTTAPFSSPAGLIEAVGEARDILARAPHGALVDDHAGCLITAGFIDAHVHYPQTQVIGSYGAQLLDWLTNYTFVEEQKFADPAHCARVADVLSR